MRILTFIPRNEITKRIVKTFESASLQVETVTSVKDCLEFARFAQYQAVIIDSDPDKFGDTILLVKLLRQENAGIALFVLTRCLNVEHRLQLFDAGADECLNDPFFAAELLARLSLSVRLHGAALNVGRELTVISAGDLELNLVRGRATRQGKIIQLRRKESDVLEYMMRNANRPIDRSEILGSVWGSNLCDLDNVVDVYICSLRSKIDADFEHKLIRTNRGIGYTFACPVAREPIARFKEDRTAANLS